MGTDATWRAAMLVLFHPETHLQPSLLPPEETTACFATLLNNLHAKSRLTPQDARDFAAAYLQALRESLLVARWKFDEGSGTIAQDSTSNGNVGALLGSPDPPQWIAGRDVRTGGHALQFANPNYVYVHNASVLEVGKNGADFSGDCSRATGFIQLVHDEVLQGFVAGLRLGPHATYPVPDAS